jgi:hypothetical protein
MLAPRCRNMWVFLILAAECILFGTEVCGCINLLLMFKRSSVEYRGCVSSAITASHIHAALTITLLAQLQTTDTYCSPITQSHQKILHWTFNWYHISFRRQFSVHESPGGSSVNLMVPAY